MVTYSRFTKGSYSRCLLWLSIWFLAIAVSITPASLQFPVEKTDLSPYPWIYLRDEEPPVNFDELIEIIAVGDIMLGRDIGYRETLFDQVKSWLKNADLLVGNLEGVVSADEKFSLEEGVFSENLPLSSILRQPLYLIAPLESISLLQTAGFDVLGMANNHAMDGGRDGLRDSVYRLRRAGIDVVGVGQTDAASYQPAIRSVRGKSIAIFAFTLISPLPGEDHSGWSVASWDSDRIMRGIKTARDQNNFVIVLMHWGEEFAPQANAWQREIAMELSEAGANLIIGHHPHTIQGTEVLGRLRLNDLEEESLSFVAYSIGNFVFDQYTPNSIRGLALKIFLDSQGLKAIQALPVRSAPEPLLIPVSQATALFEKVRLRPNRVRIFCTEGGCTFSENVELDIHLMETPNYILWSGQVDLTGDGNPEIVRRQGDQISIYQNTTLVWRSPEIWKIMDFALGDPNDDGRDEILVALQKSDVSGKLQSHPFILGYRGGIYRLLWGGSAVAQPIREVDIGDVDGDSRQDVIIIEDQEDGKQTISVWKWHGWGFSLFWRSFSAKFQDLQLVDSGDEIFIDVGVVKY